MDLTPVAATAEEGKMTRRVVMAFAGVALLFVGAVPASGGSRDGAEEISVPHGCNSRVRDGQLGDECQRDG